MFTRLTVYLLAIGFGLLSLLGPNFAVLAHGQTTIFGPEVYTRDTGKPQNIVKSFSVQNLTQEFTISVQNGEGKWGKVSSAVIELNGVRIVAPNEFNKQVDLITKPINLQEENEITVQVRSEPGTSIVVIIVGSEGEVVFGTVNGVAIKADGSQVSNANLVLQFPASGAAYEGLTDASGLFSFTDLPTDGNFVVNISTVDGLTGSANGFIIQSSPEAAITVILSPPGNGMVSGNVISETGIAVPNVIVSITFMETDYTASVITDAVGSFILEELPTDGSFIIIAFDPVTVASGSKISFITSSIPQQTIQIKLKAPAAINPEFMNGDFSNGTLDGWETSGDVIIVPQSSVFPTSTSSTYSNQMSTFLSIDESSQLSASQTATDCTSSPYSAVVTTAGDYNALGKLSQTFLVGAGQDTLVGRIRFVSNEWPTWYGSEYNDSFVVYLITPGGSKVLAKGNLNSSTWEAGVAGFNGATAEIDIAVDVSALVGQAITLAVTVSDVGDMIIDSGVVVSNFKIIDKNNRNFYAAGTWNGNTTVNASLGQAVWITVKNVNVLGTTISISPNFGQTQQLILLPLQQHTFSFSVFSEEPVGWTFDISTMSDAFIVTYIIESTWIPGMPPNPCY